MKPSFKQNRFLPRLAILAASPFHAVSRFPALQLGHLDLSGNLIYGPASDMLHLRSSAGSRQICKMTDDHATAALLMCKAPLYEALRALLPVCLPELKIELSNE